MWGEGKKKVRFYKADLSETSEPLHNPGCGWYHIYHFCVGQPCGQEGFYLDAGSEDEQLVLLFMDIGDFREQEFSEDALAYVESILNFFREKGKQMILRFAYDTEGKGAGNEPQSLSLVKRHMEQLGGIVKLHAADVILMQGIFVGSWGEMHGSRFLYQSAMAELANTLYQSTGGSCYLAVRTPAQWRSILASPAAEPELEKILAVFNDGMFGSSTDLGTYGAGSRQEIGELGSWNRDEELCWQNETLRRRPNGGEALRGNPPAGYEQAAEEMAKMHAGYLNSVYDPAQLGYWKEEIVKGRGIWNGLSGYAYIGRHLGYRFVVRNVRLVKKTVLGITVKNCGFAELCEEAECALLLEKGDGTVRRQLIDTDARNWESGKQALLRAGLPQAQDLKRCRLFLQLKGKRSGRIIRFANGAGCERILLGELR